VLCEEPRPAYDRVHLSEFFAASRPRTCRWWRPASSTRTTSCCAQRAPRHRPRGEDRHQHGRGAAYDKLVLATGSYPFVPPLPGKERKAASSTAPSKTWKPCWNAAPASTTGVVIGGGLLGLECAKALRDLKLDTHVVEFAPRLMAVQVDEGGAASCAARSRNWA
jgi:nitrite reductase (NADH) large subunit